MGEKFIKDGELYERGTGILGSDRHIGSVEPAGLFSQDNRVVEHRTFGPDVYHDISAKDSNGNSKISDSQGNSGTLHNADFWENYHTGASQIGHVGPKNSGNSAKQRSAHSSSSGSGYDSDYSGSSSNDVNDGTSLILNAFAGIAIIFLALFFPALLWYSQTRPLPPRETSTQQVTAPKKTAPKPATHKPRRHKRKKVVRHRVVPPKPGRRHRNQGITPPPPGSSSYRFSPQPSLRFRVGPKRGILGD